VAAAAVGNRGASAQFFQARADGGAAQSLEKREESALRAWLAVDLRRLFGRRFPRKNRRVWAIELPK